MLAPSSQEEKAHILDAAKKEVGVMLSANLVNKFRATKEYKEIDKMLFSAASLVSAGTPYGQNNSNIVGAERDARG